MSTDSVGLLAIFATPIALIGGAVLGLWWTRGGHYRQHCPSTAYPYPPEKCTCRCKPCTRGEHPAR